MHIKIRVSLLYMIFLFCFCWTGCQTMSKRRGLRTGCARLGIGRYLVTDTGARPFLSGSVKMVKRWESRITQLDHVLNRRPILPAMLFILLSYLSHCWFTLVITSILWMLKVIKNIVGLACGFKEFIHTNCVTDRTFYNS